MSLREQFDTNMQTAVNAEPTADSEISLSARSPILEPQETELTIRNLFRVGDSEDSDHLQDLVGNDKKKEAVVYILIGLLGALSAMAFYLLWLKVGD